MGQPIHSLGERGVIDAIRSAAPSDMNGDDAAVLSPSSFASKTVCSVDLLVEDQHFRSDWSTPYDVGRRAVVQICGYRSDGCAPGCSAVRSRCATRVG